MRRDLTRGCGACRLRFSALLTHCPVCRAAASDVADARYNVQPTSRAAWLAKWAIVLPCFPAIGLLAAAGFSLASETWPPKNALDVLTSVFGTMATCIGASLVLAIPLTLWFGIIRGIQFVLKYVVDRPRRALRVTIEVAPRSSATHKRHPMHRLRDKIGSFISAQIDAPARPILLAASAFVGAQILAEIFGEERVTKTSSFSDFGESVAMLAIMDLMSLLGLGFFIAVFMTFVEKVQEFFAKPPNLFGYDPTPPPVQNEACLERFVRDRHEITGHAAALDEVERAALGPQAVSELISPLSGQTCFAFRLMGDADGQPVDDADAMTFAVVTKDQQRCVVTNSDVVVSFLADTKIQAENARGFLQERGLPERDLSVREGLLREGDLVRVVGRRTDIRVGIAGYRGDERRLMLDAGDGLPVVILAADEARS